MVSGGDDAYGESEFLCYQILSLLEEKGIGISRTKFLKLPCLADRFLEGELGHDSVVPRYWFRYGETIDEQSMRTDFYKSGYSNKWVGREVSLSKEIPMEEFDVSQEDIDLIEESVKWAVTNHGKKNFRQLRAVQYFAYAPREFIRSYGELRDYLEYRERGEESTQYILSQFEHQFQSFDEIILDSLNTMVMSYPKDDYSSMYSTFLRWEDTVRLMLEYRSGYSTIEELLDSFVEHLSEQVLFYEHNWNISENRIEKWRELHEGGSGEFVANVNAIRDNILESRDISDELDKVSSSYSDTVRRDLKSG